LLAFGLVFVAELGDKTQLAVLMQSCKYRRPWEVFTGASAALAFVTALGAIGGEIIANLLPQGLICAGAALAFVGMGIWTWLESRSRNPEEALSNPCQTRSEETGLLQSWDWEVFTSSFGLLFVAELGDKTQLTVIGLTGQQSAAILTFAGAASALTCITALAVIGGEKLCSLIPPRLLLRISAVAFILIGIFIGLGSL